MRDLRETLTLNGSVIIWGGFLMANACKHPVASQIYLESLQLVWLRVILFRELRRALTQMG